MKKVILNNYRIFKNNHVFDFTNDYYNNNFNVIFGSNSSGKSSLINAIFWCLYDEEIHSPVLEPLYNKVVALESRDGESFPVSVECHFFDGKNTVKVKREIIFSNNETNIILSNSFLNIEVVDGINVKKLDQYWLNKVFPKILLNFTLVDSRYLVSFFEENYQNLKYLFFDYSNLAYIDDVIIHLKKVLSQLKKDFYKSTFHKIPDYNLELEKCKKSMKEIKKDIEELENALDNIDKQLNEYKRRLYDLNSGFKEMENLNRERERIIKNISNLEKKQNNLVIKILPVALVFDKFAQDNSSFNNEDLKKMLLEQPNFKSGSQYYSDIRYQLEKLNSFRDLKYNNELLKEYTKKLYEYSEMIEFMKFSLVNNRVSGDECKRLSDEIKNLEMVRERYLHQKQYLKNKEKRLEMEIAKLSKLIDTTEYNVIIENNYSKIDLCLDAISLGEDLKEKYINTTILNFTKILNNIFINDFGMNSKFTCVDISSKFSFNLINNFNECIEPNNLGYVDKLIFIISLILAFYKFFDIEIPIILKDPFMYLDNENRDNFIQGLVNSECSNQIIFILNESQYGDNVKVKLFKNIADEYELKRKPNGVVIKHGF